MKPPTIDNRGIPRPRPNPRPSFRVALSLPVPEVFEVDDGVELVDDTAVVEVDDDAIVEEVEEGAPEVVIADPFVI